MKVIITVIRKTRYTSIVEMPEATFARIENDLEYGSRVERNKAQKDCNNAIDNKDWQDDDLESVEDFEPFIEPTSTAP